jgi:hypothetical protein
MAATRKKRITVKRHTRTIKVKAKPKSRRAK